MQAGDDYGQKVFRPDPILDKPGTGNRNKQSAQSDTRAENVVLMVLSGFPVSLIMKTGPQTTRHAGWPTWMASTHNRWSTITVNSRYIISVIGSLVSLHD